MMMMPCPDNLISCARMGRRVGVFYRAFSADLDDGTKTWLQTICNPVDIYLSIVVVETVEPIAP